MIRGGLEFGFHFSAYEKWLRANGSLSLLFGLMAFYLATRFRVIKPPQIVRTIIPILAVAILIITSNRSVWLAGMVCLLILWVHGQVPLRVQARMIGIVVLVPLIVTPFFTFSGIDVNDFFTERVEAFTDYETDSSASWRYIYWVEAIDKTIRNDKWLLGLGFGDHFQIEVFDELIETSPHNVYVTLFYHVGIVGLLLYLFWIMSCFRIARRTIPLRPADQAILLQAVVVIVALSAFGVAYTFEKDYTSWLFIGMAIAVASDGHVVKT